MRQKRLWIAIFSAIGFLYWGVRVTDLSFGSYVGLVFAGFIIFTLFEYLMHRYLYHMVPTSKIGSYRRLHIGY